MEWMYPVICIIALAGAAALDHAWPRRRRPEPGHDDRDDWLAHVDVLHDGGFAKGQER